MALRSIVIGGDFVVDQHLYEGRRHQFGDVSPGVATVEEPGGAALVCGLLEHLVGSDWKVHCTAKKPQVPDPSHKAYAFWRPFPRQSVIGDQYWRCSEAMGFGEVKTLPPSCKWPPNKTLPGKPEGLIFSEGGMGFRDEHECWDTLNFDSPRWIILKTAAPVGQGDLWERLDGYRDKLVIVISASDLRRSMVRISSELSWEASLQDLLREVWSSPDLERLRRCKHLVVTFGSEGGVWLDFARTRGRADASRCRVHFVYDAAAIEGDHAREIEGTAFGYLSCVAAAAAWQLTLEKPDLCAALYGGLSGMRDLRDHGHGPALDAGKGFPFQRLGGVIKEPQHAYSRAVFTDTAPGAKAVRGFTREVSEIEGWNLLKESCPGKDHPFELARLVLLRGPSALANLPHLRVGQLLTVDRREIESLRTIAQLIRHYKAQGKAKIPLSLGIFGPPGSGKSFAVSQLANELISKDAWLEFNLSQFAGGDLIGAFHQIRDRVLQGKLPVAFFDEFDSGEYKWLQYLLAPMQDGKFQEGQITHALGKCIFVFAGATSWTFETFGPPTQDPKVEETAAHRAFRLAKGPDFKSRLDGYLDVTGPNPGSVLLRRRDGKPIVGPKPKGVRRDVENVSGYNFVRDDSDLWCPIRCALMIRTKLGCAENDKLDIDEGVLTALLRAHHYAHGARSLDKVLRPFQAERSGSVRRSFLPPRGQLAMQVNAEEFFTMCSSGRPLPPVKDLNASLIRQVAPAIHETWRRLGLAAGWIKPKSKEDCSYKHLPAAYGKEKTKNGEKVGVFLQRSNQAAAKRMPVVLGLIGLRLEPRGKATKEEQERVRQRIEYHLELLAEAEHHEWMQWYSAQGWHEGPKKDYEKQQHPCLVPFVKLKEADRNKDRDSIRHYLDFAREAGMRIV